MCGNSTLTCETVFLISFFHLSKMYCSPTIAPDRAVNYHCDSVGTRLNYEVVGQAVAAVRCSAPLDEHWKDAIEADFRKRQKKGRK